jgi:hypothetical protein
MNILEILSLYLHYISFPFRFLLIYVIVTIIFYYIRNTEDEVKINQYAKLFGKFIIWSFSMDIVIEDKDLIKYNKHLYSDRKMLAVFNHSSISDGIIIPGIFDKTSAVVVNHIVPGQCDEIDRKVKNIMIEKGKTTQKIIDFVENRKTGGNMLFIAPGSGNTPRVPGNITEFTSKGAFIGKYPILPVLVKYEDDSLNYNADRGEDHISSFLKTLLVKDYKVRIKVLDLIECGDEESVEDYKDRVYSIMNTAYKELKIHII